MKTRISVLLLTAMAITFNVSAQDDNLAATSTSTTRWDRQMSGSVGPLTFFALLLWDEEDNDDFEMIGHVTVDLNFATSRQKEMGFGLIIREDRFALKTHYRSFYNRERLSGPFWGLYGLAEWRRMGWYYDHDENDAKESIGVTSFPSGYDNKYHSLGVTCGVEAGFRLRGKHLGVTPYVGLGAPLFFTWGDLPPSKFGTDFYIMNVIYRAMNAGLKIDLIF